MKLKIKHLTIILACLFISLSCEKESLVYKGEPDNKAGVYFYSVAVSDINGNPTSYRDSMEYSFQNVALHVKTRPFYLPVKVLGNITDYDRKLKVNVIGGTAIEGVDFEKLEPYYIVQAGKASSDVIVNMIRTDKLLTQYLTIDFELEETDDFKLLLPNLINIGNKQEMNATRFRLRFSEIITPTFYWQIFAPSYFGNWSVNKFKLLNDLMGWTTTDWNNAGGAGQPVALGKFAYAATVLQLHLQDLANKKQPLYEDDGVTLMQLATKYEVDYSNL